MAQEVTNFVRFYAAFKLLPCSGDREELKRSLVRQYTWDRTDSLREMTKREYDACCDSLERMVNYQPDLKKRRSIVLLLMQELGIDTTDWARINAFCEDKRIAGKPFGRLSTDELIDLATKLRGIKAKGGLRRVSPTCGSRGDEGGLPIWCLVPMDGGMKN